MLVRAKIQIDLVGVMDRLLDKVLSHQGRQVAAHLVAERELPAEKKRLRRKSPW